MDEYWLQNLTQSTAVIVPTRSLANTLKEQIADLHIAQGRSVWEAPNILLWQDYLRVLWQHNREKVGRHSGAYTLVSARQSTLLWTQVVESSKRLEKALTLLDVQQTVRAVQRSWRLMNDWNVSPKDLVDEHVADTAQFLNWIADYCVLLKKKGLMDEGQLQQSLIAIEATALYSKTIWYCYDLISSSQKRLNRLAEQSACVVEYQAALNKQDTLNKQATDQELFESTPGSLPNRSFWQYSNTKEELRNTFEKARDLVEQNPETKINIVIPDLQTRYPAVEEIARSVFYPGVSPLQVRLEPSVYRFSLGQPLQQWPAIETALSVLKLLNNRTTVADLSFLLRNRFLGLCRDSSEECRLFERWLQRQRIRQISVDHLPELYQQCLNYLSSRQPPLESTKLQETLNALVELRQSVAQKLSAEKQNNGFAALSFTDWVITFNQWLGAWGWHTQVDDQTQDSVQYQLHTRWMSLLEEFAGLALVQKQLGLARALEVLRQMARDAIFQPQAVASPILISGIFEAIGRPVDSCFLLSMDQAYPVPPQADAFVSNSVLRNRDYPNASVDASFQQAEQVISSLFASAHQHIVSYAKHHDRDREVTNQVSPLFRQEDFELAPEIELTSQIVILDQYIDSQGSAWPSSKTVSGGTQIFQNQSLCAFRGFVTHRLGFLRADEAEFGLDSLDRGNIVHILLDAIWGELQTHAKLLELDDSTLQTTINEVVERVCLDPSLELSDDKKLLLSYEQPRLRALLKNWLEVEKRRPIGFSVVEREAAGTGNIGGITFDYIVDRLDLTDDGRSLIIDYKTGSANRNDWTSERIKSPQMPLYALCHDKIKASPVSGISFAQVQQSKPDFVDLCEAGLLRPTGSIVAKREAQWNEQRARWPQLFESLAGNFLQGHAQVNPIDEQTCDYCELQAVCRVSQLRDRSAALSQMADLAPSKLGDAGD